MNWPNVPFRALLAAFLLVCSWQHRLQAKPRPGPEHPITLYGAGKLAEARQALLEHVRKHVEAANAVKGHTPADLHSKLAYAAMAASLVSTCFELEAKHGAGGRIPSELLEASGLAIRVIDAAIADTERAPEIGKPVREVKEAAQHRKANLIIAQIVAFRNAGDRGRARAIAEEHSTFLQAMRIRIDRLLAEPATQHKPMTEKREVEAPTLSICQLLVRYYDATAAEDNDALDRCLLKTPNTMSGKDMLAIIARRRQQEPGFGGLGPVKFDAKTRAVITPRADQEYDVLCSDVLKSFHKGERLVLYRRTDRFVVRVVDGEYKLVLEKYAD